MDVEAAVRYPLRGDDATRNLLIGGGLLLLGGIVSIVALLLSFLFIGIFLFPFALVPQVLVQGYLVRVLRSTVAGGSEPPAFDEWGDLAVDGVRFVVVSVVYSLPVVVVSVLLAVVLVGATTLGAGAGPDQAGAAGVVVLLVGGVGGLLVVLLTLALLYLAPAGLCAMVQEDELSAAFDLDRLRRVGRDRDYAVAWGIGTAVMLVGNSVGQMLMVLLVGFPVVFGSQVAGFRLFALGYADALDLDRAGGGSSDDRPSTGPAAGGRDATPTPASGGAGEPPASSSESTAGSTGGSAAGSTGEAAAAESPSEPTDGRSSDDSATRG